MPTLRCSAENCAHNNDQCCCRGEIKVAGETAQKADDTCCSSFYPDAGGARNAVSQEPILDADIGCSAENCTYNKNCKCHADSIDMNGSGASESRETACLTFYPK